jgi:hypothetical protein
MCTVHASEDGRFRVLVVKAVFAGPSEYIGRRFAGQRGSSLANPRSLRAGWKRGETIARYEPELRTALDRGAPVALWDGRQLSMADREAMRREMNRLFVLLRSTGEVALRCFCAPLACHGDVIARLLLEAIQRRVPAS